MRGNSFATLLATTTLLAGTFISTSAHALPDGVNLAPSYPERPVPRQGSDRKAVVEALGEPARRLSGTGNSEVWDYGTFRVFFKGETVAFTRVW